MNGLYNLLQLFAIALVVAYVRQKLLNHLHPLRRADIEFDRILLRLRLIDSRQDFSQLGFLRRIMRRRPEYNEQERLQGAAAPILRRLEQILAAAAPQSRADYLRAARANSLFRCLRWYTAAPRHVRRRVAVFSSASGAAASLVFGIPYLFPSAGRGELVREANLPLLRAIIRDRRTGGDTPAQLIFSSVATKSIVCENVLNPHAAQAVDSQRALDSAVGSVDSVPITLLAGRYGMDMEVTSLGKGQLGARVDGVLGTGFLEGGLTHGDRFMSLDRADGTWTVGDAPYKPESDAVVLPLHGMLTADGVAYTFELELDGAKVSCLFDTTSPFPLVTPNARQNDSFTIRLGPMTQDISPTNASQLPAGTPLRDVPRAGMSLFKGARVTIEPERRLLFIEY
jgi:hypothetical protein